MAEAGKFAEECVSNGTFCKNVFPALIGRFFWQKKSEKFERWCRRMSAKPADKRCRREGTSPDGLGKNFKLGELYFFSGFSNDM